MRHLLITTLTILLGSTSVRADERIFQIGKPDRNYNDLNYSQPGDYAKTFPHDVKFVVGQSDPKKDFSGIHPGPTDVWAGSRVHPFIIEFPLDDAAGSYELKIELVDTHANAAPRFKVDVNGSSVEQNLAPGTGDASLVRPEGGKPRNLKFVLGPNYLKRGTNRIELTVTAGSWLLYDTISLTRLPGGKNPALELDVKPTIFFVERDGKLLQEFNVTASGVARDEQVKIDVRAGVDPIG